MEKTEEEKDSPRMLALAFYKSFAMSIKDAFEKMGEDNMGVKEFFGLIAYGLAQEFSEIDKSFPVGKDIHALLVVLDDEDCTAKVHAVLK